jgi:hypothetical protein
MASRNNIKAFKAWTRLAGCMALAATAGTPAQATSVVAEWNNAALDEVRRGRLGPPIVARALAIAHSCMYEAWVPYDNRALGDTASIGRRPPPEQTDANKAKAVSYAAYRCLSNLFPAGAGRLQAMMATHGYNTADTSTDLSTPQGIGNVAAAAVIADRRNDGANQYGDLATGAYADYTGYVPANAPMGFCLPNLPLPCQLNITDPYSWQPLTNVLGVVQTYVAPHWERVTPFALSAATQFDSRPEAVNGPNYRQSPDRYLADMQEILANSAALDGNRKLIVEYWADGPASELPPGHWGLFAQHVSARDSYGIDDDVKMFYAMHNASFDAGIVAWHLKRKYNGVRPITGIRYFGQGRTATAWGGPGRPVETIDVGKWSPYNPGSNLTPAFPGYVSGHATFSAASAAVLRNYTGSDYMGYSTVIKPGFGRVEANVPPVATTLSYPTFTAAAKEAALSRLYAGIHFADDNNVGLVLGDLAGQQAWTKASYLFDGGLARNATSRASSGFTRTLSWTHQVDKLSNRLLLVGISTTSADTSALSVSVGGVALSRLGAQNGWYNDNRVELWWGVNPPAGNQTVVVQLSRYDDVVAGGMSFNGVNQQTPFGTFRSAAGDSNNACVTLANAPAPLVATVLAANGDAYNANVRSGLSTAWNAVSDHSLLGLLAFNDIIGVGASGPAAPVATLCNSLNYGRRWSMLAVPLQPAVKP